MLGEGFIPATEPLHEVVQKGIPPISWDHKDGKFNLVLKGVSLEKTGDPDTGVRMFFSPPALYDLRLRKVGDVNWSHGLILPVNNVGLSNLEPDTEYECMVMEVNASGVRLPGSEIHTRKFRSPPMVSSASAL